MALLIVESNALHPDDVLVADFTVTIPPSGGSEEFDETQEIRFAQSSRDLPRLLTDNLYAVGSSTLVLRDSITGIVPQHQVLDYLYDLLNPQFLSDEFDVTGIPPANYILTEVPLMGSQVVYLNGQRQREGAVEDYTIVGDTVTMIRPIRTGDLVSVEYQHI